jgi:hypothetical protein
LCAVQREVGPPSQPNSPQARPGTQAPGRQNFGWNLATRKTPCLDGYWHPRGRRNNGGPTEVDHQLKSTIVALRHALEEHEVGHNAAVQKVRDEYEGGNAQLQPTNAAVRDALEHPRHSG